MSETSEERKAGASNAAPGMPAPPKTVDALIDKIVFSEFQKDIQETIIKVWRNIRCIENCFVEILDKDIYTNRHKGAWIVVITYKLVVEYVTEHGFKHTAAKTVVFEKCIPFPLTDAHEDHGLIDFSKSTPYLIVGKVDCVKTKFRNIDSGAEIEAIVKLEFKVIVTIKKAYALLTAGPID